MPQKTEPSKNVLLATRVTPIIRDTVIQIAEREGLNVSEWMRKIIVSEIKRNQTVHNITRGTMSRKESDDDE